MVPGMLKIEPVVKYKMYLQKEKTSNFQAEHFHGEKGV